MRLRRIGQGPPTKLRDLSFGLNVATGCLDAPLPYPLSTPIPQRPALARAALAAIPSSEYAPFDAETVLTSSYVDDCLDWPQDAPTPPATGPLPDVPALLLGGRLDLRPRPPPRSCPTPRSLRSAGPGMTSSTAT